MVSSEKLFLLKTYSCLVHHDLFQTQAMAHQTQQIKNICVDFRREKTCPKIWKFENLKISSKLNLYFSVEELPLGGSPAQKSGIWELEKA